MAQRQIKRGSHRSVSELEDAIRKFIAVHNEQPKPFVWTKSATQILVIPRPLLKPLSNQGCLVRSVVIQHQMDIQAGRSSRIDFSQEIKCI